MSRVRGVVVCSVGVLAGVLSGCASMEELRQVQMANRNLASEKAAMEQDVYDLRAAAQSTRTRTDSLEDEVSTKDGLIASLQRENETLDAGFRQAQTSLEKIANTPYGEPTLGMRLPAELDAQLQAFAADNAGSVAYDRQHGTLKWSSDLLFAFASDLVKDSASSSLRSFSEIMRSPAAAEFDVLVVGHTDNVPVNKPATRQKHPTNEHLAVHRAIAVKHQLVSSGLSRSRVGVAGYGQYKPIASNDSDADRAMNRRVEIYVVPKGAFSAGSRRASVAAMTGSQPDTNVK